MKLLDLRRELKNKLNESSIDDIDADFIISEILGVKVTELTLIDNVTKQDEEKIRELVKIRLTGKPIDKILNKAYFYGLELEVNEDVLTPRKDTEILVERAIKEIKDNNYLKVLDLCTGSGCIAIAVKKNVNANVTAVDISKKALAVAKRNSLKNNVEIEFLESDMFKNLTDKYDLILTNPPYIDSDEIKELDVEVKDNDPLIALDGGMLGLKFYNIIHENLRKFLTDDGLIIMEIGDEQKDMILSLFNDCEFIDCLKDYGGHDRVMIFRIRRNYDREIKSN